MVRRPPTAASCLSPYAGQPPRCLTAVSPCRQEDQWFKAASDTEGALNNVRRQWSVQGVLRFPPLRSRRGTVTHDASEDAQERARCGASGEFP